MIYKIPQQSYILVLLASLFFMPFSGYTQKPDTSKYGVAVTRDIRYYLNCIEADSNKRMVELSSLIPSIVYDLRYASRNNFTGKALYPKNTRQTCLRIPAAYALAAVQQELKQQQLGIKVFDAYRPYSVTVRFWEMIKDERYVAHPAKASGHNRGLAIDCTLIDLRTGKELDMGTGFDNFTDTAHQTFTDLPPAVLANRKLFRDIMTKHGFRIFDTEWWHYFWPNDRDYEALDIPVKNLVQQSRFKN